jgi:stage V sporulation protein G
VANNTYNGKLHNLCAISQPQHLDTEGGTEMEITDIRIRKIDTDGKMKAVVSVTFDNEFVVHDIKIIESQNGMFIAMPSRKTPSGEFRDIAHPIHSEARAKIQSAILEKYQTMLVEEEVANKAAKSSSEAEDKTE